MNTYKDERGNIGAVLLLLFFSLAIVGVVASISVIQGREREGTVRFDDCREIVRVNPDSFTAWTKTFTCTTRRTGKGHVISAQCVHVDTTSDGQCETAFVLQKPAAWICPNTLPYVSSDDICHATPDEGRVYAADPSHAPAAAQNPFAGHGPDPVRLFDGSITITAPNGKAYTFPSEAQADAFIADAKAKGLWR